VPYYLFGATADSADEIGGRLQAVDEPDGLARPLRHVVEVASLGRVSIPLPRHRIGREFGFASVPLVEEAVAQRDGIRVRHGIAEGGRCGQRSGRTRI